MSEGKKQLDLFGDGASPPRPRSSPEADRLEREHAEAAEIAARLPAGVRFGTSSWSFPDWAGIVYSRAARVAELAREGLREYSRHPLLTTAEGCSPLTIRALAEILGSGRESGVIPPDIPKTRA